MLLWVIPARRMRTPITYYDNSIYTVAAPRNQSTRGQAYPRNKIKDYGNINKNSKTDRITALRCLCTPCSISVQDDALISHTLVTIPYTPTQCRQDESNSSIVKKLINPLTIHTIRKIY